MGTSTGALTRINIFDPVISVNAVDIGFVGDKIELTYTQGIARYESGIPKNLRKTVKNEEKFIMKVDLMQTTIGNFLSAANLPAGALASSSILTFGGQRSTQTLTNVKFSGTDDAGTLLEVTFYKAVVIENGSWNVDNDFMKIPVTFEAIADLSRAVGDQLAFMHRP